MYPQLLETQAQITPLESGRNGWLVRPLHGTPAEAVLDPAWWANAAKKLAPGERVEVIAQDASYHLDLWVMEVGPTPERKLWVRVRILRAWPETETVFPGAAPGVAKRPALTTAAEELAVEWGGPGHKWRITRTSDKTVIAHGFASREDAEAQLAREREAA